MLKIILQSKGETCSLILASAIDFIGSLPKNEVLLPCLPSRLIKCFTCAYKPTLSQKLHGLFQHHMGLDARKPVFGGL